VSGRVEVIPVAGLPEVAAGDPLGRLIARAVTDAGERLADTDVLVVSQKVVSKAEGRVVDLGGVEASRRAVELARSLGKDPRMVELILRESAEIVRAERNVLIVEGRAGWVSANAGIDASNVPGDDRVTLLPKDPDASARRVRADVRAASGAAPGVVVADSFGRPWRLGQADVAIGCAGVAPLDDWRGRRDRDGRELAATVIAVADELSAAADLARAKDQGVPAAIVRGVGRFVMAEDGPGAAALRRPRADDLFRRR
jgi:coenzyme F420-0:L-glutamate ligase / coenzyme F420-1:gamma-L-glutamate ligase